MFKRNRYAPHPLVGMWVRSRDGVCFRIKDCSPGGKLFLENRNGDGVGILSMDRFIDRWTLVGVPDETQV